MTDRERWTVYPLLFLTLGIALKDKITRIVSTDELLCKRVQCAALVVADQQGKDQVVLSTTRGGGLIRTRGSVVVTNQQGQEQMLLASNSDGGLMHTRGSIVVTDRLGREQVVISSNDDGGRVQTDGNHDGLKTMLAHTGNVAGLLFVDPEGKVLQGSVFVRTATPPPSEISTPDDAPKK